MPEHEILRGLTAYYRVMLRLGRFCITHPIPESAATLAMLGLPEKPAVGDSILPGSMGRHTDLNANGRVVVRKDLPKIREARMCWSRWTDWHGKRHEGVQNRTIEVYHRQRVPAPFEYLNVVSSGDELLISSRILSLEADSQEAILHVASVFKEIFDSLTISSDSYRKDSPGRSRKLHWKILPDGEYPYERARSELDELLRSLGDDRRRIVEYRIEHITEHRPDFMAVGIGGFRDYVVFGFRSRGRYVFESPNLDNATYIFQDNWEHLAQLTKTQIIERGLQQARIIHDRSWVRAFRDALTT